MEEFKNHISEQINRGQLVSFEWCQAHFPQMDPALTAWLENVLDQKFLESFIREDFREIIFHDGDAIQIHSSRPLQEEKIILNYQDLFLSLKVLALKNQFEWNFKNPSPSFVCFLFGKKLRVTLLHPCLSPHHLPKIFIRNLKQIPLSLSDFSLEHNLQQFFRQITHEGQNILISGSTGSGKTTFMTTLTHLIPQTMHTVILEDTEEIFSENKIHTRMVTSQTDFSLNDFLTFALRMTPERIILGELRSKEVVPYMLALNTGHKGVMSTIHANSAQDALNRLSLLFQLHSGLKEIRHETVLKMICQNIGYVIQMEHRKVKEVARVLGSEGDHAFIEKISA